MRLSEAAKAYRKEAQEALGEEACDHAAGICWCAYRTALESLDEALEDHAREVAAMERVRIERDLYRHQTERLVGFLSDVNNRMKERVKGMESIAQQIRDLKKRIIQLEAGKEAR